MHVRCMFSRQRDSSALVAQLDRAPDFESGGRGFESLRARQFQAAPLEPQPATALARFRTRRKRAIIARQMHRREMPMRPSRILLTAALVFLVLGSASFRAQAQIALSGLVSSSEEGAMEGVLVSAKKEGATITTTVVSDVQGRYRFPSARIEPGKYTI